MKTYPKLVAAVAALAGALLLPALATAAPTPLVIPAFAGLPGLPGPIAPAATPAANMTTLAVSPDVAPAGTKFTVTGSGLPANTSIAIVWGTANVTWVVDARPDSVDYLGRSATKLQVVLGQGQTDAQGRLAVTLTAPRDFGGIHDIYAVANGVQLAHGGFLVARTATMSPKSGPIGTMITVTYNGLGSSLYEGGASLLYDNHYVGAMMANWTRGVAVAHIRATGPVGTHEIEVADAISFKYLNIQQSPIPWGRLKFAFTVTKDNGRPKAQMDWPARRPTLDAKTTLQQTGLAASTSASAQLASSAGAVNSKVAVTAKGLTRRHPRRHGMVDGCRQPRQLHRHVLEVVSSRSATRPRTPTARCRAPSPFPTAWRLARRAAAPGRQGDDAGSVLRQAEHLRQRRLVADREGRPAVHRAPQGARLDAARQHDRGRLRQQLRRLRLRLQQQRRHGHELVATGGPGTHLIDMYPLL